jgi:ABC-2 type transport system ATP-binding protein
VAILFNEVHKTFTTSFSRKKVRAVIDLTLAVETGEVIGIVGPNGAGKSTALKMLMGFVRPDSGEITVLGSLPENPKVRFKTGYLPENPYYYDHLSAEELMRFSARTCGMNRQQTEANVDRLLRLMGLEHARKRKLRTYSKGMIQRAGICFALVHDPQLVIFDEPMSGLDPTGRKHVVDLVLSLKAEGKTVLFCSHILNDVERLCDRVVIMSGGRLRRVMTRQELASYHKELILLVPELSDNLVEELLGCDVSVGKTDESWKIVCPRVKTTEAMQILTKHGVKEIGMDTPSNVLERVFFDTIR